VSVQFNHTVQKSATFLVELLGLPSPRPFGAMLVVQLTNGVSLDFTKGNARLLLSITLF
jgi:hypothetical protein